MFKVVLVAIRVKEAAILEDAFKKLGLQIVVAQPSGGNYIQFLQFRPDVIIIEMPDVFMDQMASIRLVKKNKQLAGIPILCYGNHKKEAIWNALLAVGVHSYLERPLKFGQLLSQMDAATPAKQMLKKLEEIRNSKGRQRDQELALLLIDGTSPQRKIEIMVSLVGKLLAFPFTLTKVLEVSNNGESGAADLAKVIAADSATLSTVLKVSNSIYFASRNREVKTPRDAIVRIGFAEVKNITLGMGVLNLVSGETKGFGFDRTDFWYFCVARAVLTEKLARQAQYPDLAVAFMAGLLSDFSILLMDEFFEEAFAKILQRGAGQVGGLAQASREILGFAHHEFAWELFAQWRLPKELQQALRFSSTAGQLDWEKPDPIWNLGAISHLAGILAKSAGIGNPGDLWVEPISEPMLKALKIPATDQNNLLDMVYNSVEVFASFLGLERRSFAPPEQKRKATFLRLGRQGIDPVHLHLGRYLEMLPCKSHEEALELEREHNIGLRVVNCTTSESSEIEGVLESCQRAGVGVLALGCPAELPPTLQNFCTLQSSTDLRSVQQTLETMAMGKDAAS